MKFRIGLILSALIVLFSCKKEYECCWYLDGKIQENVGFCVMNKLSKKEAEEQQNTVNDLEWKCEEK